MSPLIAAVAATFTLLSSQAPSTDHIDGLLTVLWYSRTATADPPGFIFEDAQASFGPTVLTCDKLTVDLDPLDKHLVAEGHVHVLDIDGTLDADRLEIDWVRHTGSGQGIVISAKGFTVRAKSASVGPNGYDLSGIEASPIGHDDPQILRIQAPSAHLSANGNVKIFRPRIFLLGKKIITLKEYVIAPGTRSTGQPLPSFSYGNRNGFSGGWVPGLMLSDTSAINGSIHLGEHAVPSKDLLFSQSVLPSGVSPGNFVPYSDFSVRFGWSYFENVYIADPATEQAFATSRRFSLSLGTNWNETPVGRSVGVAYNKPVDFVVESAGEVKGIGIYGQLRAQQMEEESGPLKENRLELSDSIAAPQWGLGRGLYTDMRFDSYTTVGDARPYGWGHAQAGLVAKPNRHLRIGAAYGFAGNFGTPLFVTDELYRLQSLNVRADLSYGPRDLSVLMKYDPVRGDWYDTEIEFGQAIRCFEPYVIYREFPRGLLFGIRFRVDDLLDALRRRGALKGPGSGDDR